MEHYTIASVTKINGTEIAGGKYILYTLDKTPLDRSDHYISNKLYKLTAAYLALAGASSPVILSTKPAEQFISLSIGNKKTATLRLEELLDSEKKEIETAILQAEQ